MYGRKARLPVDLDFNIRDDCENPGPEDVNIVQEAMSLQRQIIPDNAHNNIEKAQMRQKRLYDKKRHHTSPFLEGTLVLLKNNKNKHRMGSVLEPKWLGPYTVYSNIGKGRLKLRNASGIILKNTYHACNIKKYLVSLAQTDYEAHQESEEMEIETEEVELKESYAYSAF